MNNSSLIQEAIEVALLAHSDQKRKTREVPYIVHPLAVALLVSQAQGTTDQVVSAILHDTVEDSPPDNKITFDFLERKFGENISSLVRELTEQSKTVPWHERKEEMRTRLRSASKEALLVKAADVLHNLIEKRLAFGRMGEEAFSFFAVSKEEQMESHQKTIYILEEAWKENPLLEELKSVYHDFVSEVNTKSSS
jgi:(p)ppGpp synthase/HD superfamily hydrolase